MAHHDGSQKYERYIQASILLALKIKSSYGYELIQEIPRFGFFESQAPPGMIYRHLRDLEENGLVASQWETQETGPAKRVYQLTDEGLAALEFWIGFMDNQVRRLARFIQTYREIRSPKKN